MLSRVAENVYWLSRYLERIENSARLINVYSRSLMDLPDVQSHDGWMPLISITGLDGLYLEHYNEANAQDVTTFLVADTRNPGSIINASIAIRNNLRSARDVFPKQLYQRISALVRYVHSACEQGVTLANRRQVLEAVERQVLEISGAIHGSLRHDQAYRFTRMACYLERADMTTRVLDVPKSVTTPDGDTDFASNDHRDWMAALGSVSAMQMYRRHVRQPVNATGCLDFLLKDAQLPAACLFCLLRLDRCLEHFPNHDDARALVASLHARIDAIDTAALAADALARHRFLDTVQSDLLDIGDAITRAYFPPVPETA
ncbi:MAG: alpha-E domain-containing protein [Pseudomonadota bacterium]